jgi:hypothetical protein
VQRAANFPVARHSRAISPRCQGNRRSGDHFPAGVTVAYHVVPPTGTVPVMKVSKTTMKLCRDSARTVPASRTKVKNGPSPPTGAAEYTQLQIRSTD